MSDIRLKKISELYRHEIAEMLIKDFRDPRLAGVEITHVMLTPDLRIARVYFDMPGGRSREQEVLKSFLRAKGFIKRELATKIKIRYTPDLQFFYDEAAEMGKKVASLFKQIEEEKKS